ncbi:MAG: Ig-like domain-containing protein [Candidatus Saccharibacteria bacterium]
MFLFHIPMAHANQGPQSNVGWIPQDQLNAMSSLDTNGCKAGGTMWAQGEYPWIYEGSSNVDGTAAAPFAATAGQNILLNIYEETFICFWGTNPGSNPSVNIFGGNAAQPHDSTIDAAPFGLSYEPIPEGDWPGENGQLLSNQSKFQFGTPTASKGSVTTGILGNNPQVTNFGNGSRYWEPYNGSSYFYYTAPTTLGLQQITINLPIYGASQFADQPCATDSGGFCSTGAGPPAVGDACVGYNVFGQPGGVMDTNYYDANQISSGCLPQIASFNIWINVTSAYNNTATLSAYGSTPSSGLVTRGQTLQFTPGMYNVGTNSGPPTYIELHAYSGSGDVGNVGSVANGGDPFLYVDGYNSGCMASGEGCVPHYYWGRTSDPPEPQAYSIVGYGPASYAVSTSATPGDQVCFHTAVTPANSNGGPAYSNPLCYGVYSALQCTVTPSAANPLPGQPFTVTVSMAATTGPVPTNIASDGTIKLLINGSPYTGTYTTNSSGQAVITINNLGYGPSTIQANFTAANGYVSSPNCSTQVTVAAAPYFRAYGGDVSSGVDSRYPVSCYDTLDGDIKANNLGGTNPNLGSGTNEAALATGGISGFVSGQNNASNLFAILNPLTYANTNSLNGNYIPTVGTCGGVTDYYSQAMDMAQTIQSDAGVTITTSCANIGAMAIAPGNRYICYTTGNVTITGNITYSGLAGATATNLPSFEVVTKGNIYVNTPSVTTLTGTYIAENGNLCDTGSSCDIDNPPAGDATSNIFGDRLTINGTFIANRIALGRSSGSVNDDAANGYSGGNDPATAEEFDYSPINWLAPGDPTSSQVDAITSLPPVF